MEIHSSYPIQHVPVMKQFVTHTIHDYPTHDTNKFIPDRKNTCRKDFHIEWHQMNGYDNTQHIEAL